MCIRDRRHDGGKRVVVADVAADQLVDADRVVLVDNRDNAHRDELRKRVLNVLPAALMVDDVAGEEHLRYRAAVLAEKLVVNEHQLALADRRERLLLLRLRRALPQAELAHSDADRARRDEDNFPSAVLQVAEYAAQRLNPPQIQLSVLIRQRGGSHLHDDALCLCDFRHVPSPFPDRFRPASPADGERFPFRREPVCVCPAQPKFKWKRAAASSCFRRPSLLCLCAALSLPYGAACSCSRRSRCWRADAPRGAGRGLSLIHI